MPKVKTEYGEFTAIGYEAYHIHYPIEFKPDKGFVYVNQPDGSIGAIPKKDVLNWYDLPKKVQLPKELQDQRAKCPDFIRQQKSQ